MVISLIKGVSIGGRGYKAHLEKRAELLKLHREGKLGSRYYKGEVVELPNGRKITRKKLKSPKELIKEMD